MLSELLEGFQEILHAILVILGLRSDHARIPPVEDGMLRVFIKHQSQTSNALLIDLNPEWSVAHVKEQAAPKFGIQPEELKIIFAGRELPNNVLIENCNIGQQSFLHAVQIKIKQGSGKDVMSIPSNYDETLEMNTPSQSQTKIHTQEFFQNELQQISPEVSEESASIEPVTENVTCNTYSPISGSNFYVYCTECNDMTEGKLRVMCSSCHTGAFIVLRDPMCWEDVLEPNRVPGSCETPSCGDGNAFSKFFFKCTSHVTHSEDESYPPLPQVKRNRVEVLCLACGDPNDPMFVFDCGHATCIDCFKQYILLKLSTREFVLDSNIGYSVGCPILCSDSLVKDSHHFRLLGDNQYERYQRFGAEEYVLKSGGVLCPQPDCGMGIIDVDEDCEKIVCVHGCGYVFCRRCLEGWHMGDCFPDSVDVPSASVTTTNTLPIVGQEIASRSHWEDASRRAIKVLTKPCPRCRVSTERDGGCMHMHCVKCLFNWCWICQVEWSRDCMGNHWFD